MKRLSWQKGKKETKENEVAATTHDVTTLAGWLATYDELVTAAAARNGWCSSWRGIAYLDVPDPQKRKSDTSLMLAAVPDEYLNEDGKAKKASSNDEQLAKLRAAASETAARNLNNGNIHEVTVSRILTALGATMPQRDTTHAGDAYISVSYRTPSQLTPEQRDAATATLQEAARALFEGIDGIEIRDLSGNTTSSSNETYAWRVPAVTDAPASS